MNYNFNNDACKEYVLLALKALGYKNDQICEILEELYRQFDEVTVSEAEQKYIDSLYE